MISGGQTRRDQADLVERFVVGNNRSPCPGGEWTKQIGQLCLGLRIQTPEQRIFVDQLPDGGFGISWFNVRMPALPVLLRAADKCADGRAHDGPELMRTPAQADQ